MPGPISYFPSPSMQHSLPSVFDDSMSYYETITRVIAKLNDVVTQSNELLTAGLQQPLRDSLNAMAASGELADMIQELVVLDGGTF
jgi:hypothetical protein